MKKVAVITGASSGMGREFASIIDRSMKNIDEIWLIARRRDRLEELQGELNTACIIIDEDVNTNEFENKYKKILSQEKPEVKMLINCAGYGLVGTAGIHGVEVETGVVETNCVALTKVTLLTLPYMAKNGRIINLASSAAFFPQPGFAIYAASKSYVLSFSRALNSELRNKNIYVTAVCPGPVNTEFFNIAENGVERAWYKDLFMSRAKDVVRQALKDSVQKKEVSVYGTSMKLLMFASKVVPHSVALGVMKVLNGKERKREKKKDSTVIFSTRKYITY